MSNSDKTYSQQLGFPYQYFEEEVLTAEEVHYRLRLIYISLIFKVISTKAAVPYVSVMFPPSLQVTSSERVINPEIGQSNRAEDRMNPRFITIPLLRGGKIVLREKQMDQLYAFSIRYKNVSINSKKGTLKLQGGTNDPKELAV